jgi:hypothetical protein
MIDSEKSERIFENFAQFADLSRADRVFFTRRTEVIIQTLFQIPLQELDALFHADPLGTAPPSLMEVSKLYHSTHRKI